MNRSTVEITRELWKDYPNVDKWLEAISHPEKHIQVLPNSKLSPDEDYIQAVESLNYILRDDICNSELPRT